MSIELIVKNKLPYYDVYLRYNEDMISLNVNHHPRYGLELANEMHGIDHLGMTQSWTIEPNEDLKDYDYDLPEDYHDNPMEITILFKGKHKNLDYLSYHNRCKEQEEILMIKFEKYANFLSGAKIINGI